jgi:predicted MFS family arabinose efflux permease
LTAAARGAASGSGAGTSGRVDHDGGAAWVVVVGSFLGHIPVFGTVYSFTVLFDPIADEFGASSGATAWIVSIASACMMGVAVVSGRLSERHGAPPVVVGGGVLIAAGFLLTAGAASLWQLYVTFGLVVGVGLSSITMPSFGVISRRFTRRRGLAIGLASAGSGFASLVVAPLTEALVDGLGWRDALRVLAVVHLVLAIAAACLLRGDRRAPATAVAADARPVHHDPAFRVLYKTSALASYGYFVPFVFLVPFATDHGLSDAGAARLVALMGVASVAGRIVLGALADRVGGLRVYRLSLATMAVGVAAWPLTEGALALGAFGLWYGFFAGSVPALFPTVSVQQFGAARMASVTGLLSTSSALGVLLGPPTSGWLFDWSGSYVVPAAVAAVGMAGAALGLRAMPPRPAEHPPGG